MFVDAVKPGSLLLVWDLDMRVDVLGNHLLGVRTTVTANILNVPTENIFQDFPRICILLLVSAVVSISTDIILTGQVSIEGFQWHVSLPNFFPYMLIALNLTSHKGAHFKAAEYIYADHSISLHNAQQQSLASFAILHIQCDNFNQCQKLNAWSFTDDPFWNCHHERITRRYRDAQDRLFWMNRPCSART